MPETTRARIMEYLRDAAEALIAGLDLRRHGYRVAAEQSFDLARRLRFVARELAS